MPKSGDHYIRIARKNGLRVENGRGDHAKVYGPAGRGMMTVPLHKELANGTECAIKKWFRALGIVLTTLLLAIDLLALWNVLQAI